MKQQPRWGEQEKVEEPLFILYWKGKGCRSLQWGWFWGCLGRPSSHEIPFPQLLCGSEALVLLLECQLLAWCASTHGKPH